ncbi:MAG: N-acetylglucosamine-6-phosphate deacetylase [Oscillospiraceae bacterium]
MRITGAKVFDAQKGFEERDLYVEHDKIVAHSDGGPTVDATGCYVIPGLTDLHFHGCMGEDFSDGNAAGFQKMADYELSRGVTQICPAGMTLTEEQLTLICTMAANHKKAGKGGADLVGVNLEGPFLSMEKKGAQNGDWLQAPSVSLLRKLEKASEGLVKLVSIAPELPGAMDFIKEVHDEVVVSVAHTTADYDTAKAAFDNGAKEITHLFNAMPPFNHRAPGVIGAGADDPHAMAEIISDGIHIHPSVIRAAFKMFGKDRMILISDTMRAAGMSDGDYTLGGQAVKVTGRLATLLDGTIAGSATDLMACLKTCVSFGIPLETAVTAAAVNPARVLGLTDVGSLAVGKTANIAILDGDLNLKQVVFHGELQE